MDTAFSELSPTVTQWPFLSVLSRIGLAVAMGVFVGLEREHSQKTGMRTFALTSLFCCLGGLMGTVYAALALVFTCVVIAAMNFREMANSQKLALTTTSGMIVVAFSSVLYGQGHLFAPTVAGISTAALLAWKESISRFAGVVSNRELRSAILLAILTFIVLPILPDHPVDPWNLVEPRSNWATVIIIAAIGFINYVLMRLLGTKGLGITAFFGGLVNSRKVIVELGLRLKHARGALLGPVQRGILLATGAMLVRNLVIIAVLASPVLIHTAPPILLMLLVCTVLWWRATDDPKVENRGLNLELDSPFRLKSALQFGLLFLAINIAGALAQRHFGTGSFYFVSAIGGLLSSASAIAATADLFSRGEISSTTATNGFVLATLTSVVVNIPLVHGLMPDKSAKRHASLRLALIALVGVAGIGLVVVLP